MQEVKLFEVRDDQAIFAPGQLSKQVRDFYHALRQEWLDNRRCGVSELTAGCAILDSTLGLPDLVLKPDYILSFPWDRENPFNLKLIIDSNAPLRVALMSKVLAVRQRHPEQVKGLAVVEVQYTPTAKIFIDDYEAAQRYASGVRDGVEPTTIFPVDLAGSTYRPHKLSVVLNYDPLGLLQGPRRSPLPDRPVSRNNRYCGMEYLFGGMNVDFGRINPNIRLIAFKYPRYGLPYYFSGIKVPEVAA